MSQRKYEPEEIIGKLREAEVLLSQGTTVDEVCRKIEVNKQICYRWRQEYGGLRADQARWMRQLEKENAKLKRLVADLSVDNQILKEAASGNSRARRNGRTRFVGRKRRWGYRSAGRAGGWSRRGTRSAAGYMCPTTSRG